MDSRPVACKRDEERISESYLIFHCVQVYKPLLNDAIIQVH